MSNLWEKAVKQNWIFESTKMQLNIIQLCSLPLKAKDDFDLDTVAVKLHNKIKESGELSFVSDSNAGQTELEEKLELVKLVIAGKKAEAKAKIDEANRKKQLEQYKGVLADIQMKKLGGLSEEEVLARIKELEGK